VSLQHNRRRVVLLVARAFYLHGGLVEVDIFPLKSKYLADPQPEALGHNHHGPVRFGQLFEYCEILVHRHDNRFPLTSACPWNLDQRHWIAAKVSQFPEHRLLKQAIHESLDLRPGPLCQLRTIQPLLTETVIRMRAVSSLCQVNIVWVIVVGRALMFAVVCLSRRRVACCSSTILHRGYGGCNPGK